MTWNDAWQILNADGTLVERSNQRTLGEAVFTVTTEGGTLLGEAPVGVGKSFAYLIPLIYRAKAGERGVVSTETTALQDQLYDKDLVKLNALFGPFKFHSLKGRSWYLCKYRANSNNPIIQELGNRGVGNGERRDVERVLGRVLLQEEWDEISGETEFCASNKCKPEGCYSTVSRNRAASAEIVVTNHAMLRTDAEMEDGFLGDYKHLVIDEAHSLERVLVDGWASELRPYNFWQYMDSIWKSVDSTSLRSSAIVGSIEEGERLAKEAAKSVVSLFTSLAERRDGSPIDDSVWKREQFALSQQYLSGNVGHSVLLQLEDYELQSPGRYDRAAAIFEDVRKQIESEMKNMERVPRKVRKGATAAKNLSKVLAMVAEALDTRDGIIMRYGVPYAIIGHGEKAWKGGREVTIRCVPLDVSEAAKELIWKGRKSVTLVSGTLRDETDGSFRYVQDSLGLENARTLVVGTGFDFANNQLIYLTPATHEPIDVPGAKYAIEELVDVIEASNGRALVLFTANAELEYAAEYLRNMQYQGQFQHRLFIQERGVSKADLVRGFTSDTNSVLLGSKSFFTGVDFPGETCSIVVLAKFPLPQYNALCKAQIAWWRKRGYPKWYEREALQVFKQANGRLIRNETDRGVIAILDRRVADPKENVCNLTKMELTTTGSAFTNQLSDVKEWLNR